MSNKDLIFDSYAGTDKCMARYFATRTNLGRSLNFNEATNSSVIPDLATIQVHMTEEFYSCSQCYICADSQAHAFPCNHIR